MNYGKAFRELREEKGLSRAEVAKRIGCTPSALSKIENGKTVPKEKTIDKFCSETRVPLAYFYDRSIAKEDYGVAMEKDTQSRLSEAIGQLENYQNRAQSGYIHEILYDLYIVRAELEGEERPEQEDQHFDSWLGFGQTK